MGEVVGIGQGWRVRLERAAQHERDTRAAHGLALQARNELIHAAIDDGYPQGETARIVNLSRPSITRILADPPAGAAA